MRVFIGLGANLGDLALSLRQALDALSKLPDTRLVAVSGAYRSAPINANGPEYLNAVAELDSDLPPADLLLAMQAIEQAQGRQRSFLNAPRTLDLDLLLYGEAQIATASLTVPHPRLHQRAFVLLPLLALAPGLHAPGLGCLADYLPEVAEQAISRQADLL